MPTKLNELLDIWGEAFISFNYSNFPSAIYKPGQSIAYLISPELALDMLLNYAKNNLDFY